MDNERRRAERIQPAFRVRTEVLPEVGDIHMAVFADIINLSEVGICLRSPLKLTNKDKLIIYLPTLEEKKPLEIHGEVIWIKSSGPLMYEYGMKFIGVNKLMESNIRSKISAIMNSYFDQEAMNLN
jgi:PilZ domain